MSIDWSCNYCRTCIVNVVTVIFTSKFTDTFETEKELRCGYLQSATYYQSSDRICYSVPKDLGSTLTKTSLVPFHYSSNTGLSIWSYIHSCMCTCTLWQPRMHSCTHRMHALHACTQPRLHISSKVAFRIVLPLLQFQSVCVWEQRNLSFYLHIVHLVRVHEQTSLLDRLHSPVDTDCPISSTVVPQY